MIRLIIGSAHINDDQRISDYIESFKLVEKQKHLFDRVTIIETISKDKVEYLENSGFEVFYSRLGNTSVNKGINWMNHIGEFLIDCSDDDLFIFMSGRYMLQSQNNIEYITKYMIDNKIEFLAKNDDDLFEGIGVHTFLIFFRKKKFLEFIKYHHEFNLSSPCIEHDLKKFLLKSNNCLILNGQFIMGIKTNYYLSGINGIC